MLRCMAVAAPKVTLAQYVEGTFLLRRAVARVVVFLERRSLAKRRSLASIGPPCLIMQPVQTFVARSRTLTTAESRSMTLT
jgi:hypothetical protein